MFYDALTFSFLDRYPGVSIILILRAIAVNCVFGNHYWYCVS